MNIRNSKITTLKLNHRKNLSSKHSIEEINYNNNNNNNNKAIQYIINPHNPCLLLHQIYFTFLTLTKTILESNNYTKLRTEKSIIF